ncbi:hypothetical protein BJ742DRAFT_780747 [Cladochytrium replicatum]|nr:hypothetical protein BJ742DRAFT_780747 [Cladochytrium replicatum]
MAGVTLSLSEEELQALVPKFTAIRDDFVSIVDEIASGSNSWTKISESGGVLLKKRSYANSAFEQFASVSTVDIPAAKIYELLEDFATRSQWDAVVSYYSELAHLPDIDTSDGGKMHVGIMYSQTNAMFGGMISGRDFVDFRTAEEATDSQGRAVYRIGWASPENGEELVPTAKGYTRGFNFTGGISITAINEKQSQITYTIRSDPRGSLSAWLVNKGVTFNLTSFIASVKKRLS